MERFWLNDVQVLLTAGTDTSAGTMEWAMSLLLNNPQVLKKAQEENYNLVGHYRLIGESNLVELPYLHCIINKTLRMYPARPLLELRESSEDCSMGGFHFPRGTMLLVNLWAIQNDPTIWYEPMNINAERFDGFEGVRDGFNKISFMEFIVF